MGPWLGLGFGELVLVVVIVVVGLFNPSRIDDEGEDRW